MIRIGAVGYLNARPLVLGLERQQAAGRLELATATPAALADAMLAGELDLALLPVIELARLPDLELVPGLGITTCGESRSVLLISKVPVEEIRSVALDPDSRTSNALARLLLGELWGCRPEFVTGEPSLERTLEASDAAVRIGDKALFEPAPPGSFVHDLGGAWTEKTRLPFVFAAWAARPGVVDRELYGTLHDSRRLGSRSLERIAAEYTWCGRTYPEIALDYLMRRIRYRLGAAELEALALFLRGVAAAGIIAHAPPIRLALARRTDCHDAASTLAP